MSIFTNPVFILTVNIIAVVAGLFNLMLEIKRDLMMMQQNSYRINRYSNWLRVSGDTTSAWRLAGIVILFIALSRLPFAILGTTLIALFAIMNTIRLWRKKYKKPLVITPRIRRNMIVIAVLCLIVIAALVLINGNFELSRSIYVSALVLLGLYLLSHVLVMVSFMILSPVEKSINNGYIKDARRILASMPDLKIIGITGSYGKTSTKHYLHRILSEQFSTTMTPGSYNTTLGVVRTIREYLQPYNEVFIVEMGAKQPNDIKEICDIVNPSMGIVTAVGPQHLESFKSIENVQKTKFELVDSLPTTGLAVINNDFEKIADRKVDNVKTIRYAVSNTQGADVIATDIVYSARGTEFTVTDMRENGYEPLRLVTKLLGECNISDLLAAVIIARHLGMSDAKIKFAVAQIAPVIHRLSITHTGAGVTIIDDAFNSNPVGSRMALDVLAAMKTGKRILVTPGMIELGDEQYELNKEFGRHAAGCADIVIIVGEYNREPIAEGLREGGIDYDNKVLEADTFDNARVLLSGLLRNGDVVLYENDLPDTFK